MADRYFDRNGTTTGFGTLTGAWDTTTASWSTSSAGTATPATFTFTNVDTAWFGSTAVASTTAGTATISTGVTVTLNKISLANVPAQQTIAASGTGNLTFAGTTPSIDAANAGGLLITAPINGTVGLTSGAASRVNIADTVSAISGTVTLNSGNFMLARFGTAGTPNMLSSISAFSLNSGANLEYAGTLAYTEDATISGSSGAVVSTYNNGGVTLQSAGTFLGAFTLQNGGVAPYTPTFIFSEFPSSAVALRLNNALSGVTACTDTMRFTHASNASTSATIDLNQSVANASGLVGVLENNAASGVVTTFAGNVTKAGATNTPCKLRLTGTNDATTLSGNILVESTTGNLEIEKLGAGQWTLSGNNAFQGKVTSSAGTLVATSNTALGAAASAAGVTVNATGVIVLSGNITLNKSSTTFTIHGNNPIQSVGDNTVQTAGVTLGGTTTFEVTTGNRLAISNTGAITDGASTFGITKTGDGELALAAFSNTYDGAVTVSAGTLAIGSVGALGTGVATVQVTSNLKYTGAAGTLSRATQLNGAAPSLEAAGTGALTVSNLSQDVTTKTVTLKGANTDANTITSSLSDNSGVLSLTKEGAGKWVTTGARSYTGTTAVNGGVLRLETTNSATASGAVTIGASGTVELVTNTLASTGATSGEVLGTGNVTVNGGTIKTHGGTTQKGQVRYGGNLTFGAGSTLYIGAAA